MLDVKLLIQTSEGERAVTLETALTIGRTNLSDLVLSDAGLSRRHATFESANGEVWVFDENSTNGTFVNGEQVSPNGIRLADSDEIRLGNETIIFVQIRSQSAKPILHKPQPEVPGSNDKTQRTKDKTQVPAILVVAGVFSFFVIALALGAIWLVSNSEKSANTSKTKTPVSQSADIPVTIVDPLKGDPDELDDLLALFAETQEEDLKGEDIDDVKTAGTASEDSAGLNVTRAFWEAQKAKALAPRSGSTGITPAGLNPPKELAGDGVVKQKAKLAELIKNNYQQPMDFGDLAQKRLAKELVELPMATQYFYLEVGSSASEEPFTAFSFENGATGVAPGSPKFQALSQLASNFGGQTYDVNNGRDRKQMRIRLLRMFHPRAKDILGELAKAYSEKFNRPLRITSLTRSMDYQIALNKVNPNSFKVRGAGSLPPHTSGCAFDLGRKHMTAEEQNFVMQKLAEMENRGVLDALIEYNANACFHVFIYPDGKPPR
ncbi:MAG TPA: DUF5715 family protein [Pyrinomonadaceae bacterium]|nr:DUF5715 family protein [Pyrinomonadaceae bacterium]